MFEGKWIRLRAFDNADLMPLWKSMNDEEAMGMLSGAPLLPATVEDTAQFMAAQTSHSAGEYQFAMERLEDGSYDMMVDIMGPSYIALRCQENVDAAFAEGLADRIASLDLPSLNGYYKSNNVRSHSYYLSVRYTSGEKLTIGASGDAADTCPFDVNALMAYVKEMALAKGQGGY